MSRDDVHDSGTVPEAAAVREALYACNRALPLFADESDEPVVRLLVRARDLISDALEVVDEDYVP